MAQGGGCSGFVPEVRVFIISEVRRRGFLKKLLRRPFWEERIECYNPKDKRMPSHTKLLNKLERGEIGSFEIYRAESLPPPYIH